MTSAGQGCRYLNKFVPVKSEHLELQQIESDLKQTYAEASKLSEKFKENALDAESKNWQDPKKRESSLQNLLSNKQEKEKALETAEKFVTLYQQYLVAKKAKPVKPSDVTLQVDEGKMGSKVGEKQNQVSNSYSPPTP